MENQNSSMDEVSAEVRCLLLTYPGLFTNRLDCLTNIFTTTNYIWTDDGRMVHNGPTDYRDTMSYEDLDEREARNLEHIKEGSSYMIGLTQIRAYKIARQRMERAAAAQAPLHVHLLQLVPSMMHETRSQRLRTP